MTAAALFAGAAAATEMRQHIPLNWKHAAFPANVPGLDVAMEAAIDADSKVRYERYSDGSTVWFMYRIVAPNIGCSAAGAPGVFFRLECGRPGLMLVLTRGAQRRTAKLELRYYE